MRLGYTLPVLIAASAALAWGSRSDSYEPPSRRAAVKDTIVASLDVTGGEEVRFAFRVTNSSAKRVELRFPSGQTHDVIVLDSQGREVWRWSEGRMFTQAMQTKLLGATDTVTFSESWRPQKPGTFTAVARLLSENFPVEERSDFSLGGKLSAKR
jgi:hypothetical protein